MPGHSPTGKYYPPEPRDTQPPVYPEWLKDTLTWDIDDCIDRPHNTTEPAYLAEQDHDYDAYLRTHPNP
ncbi:hypothetical protein [Arthrobacter psychrolactophilus]